MRRPLIILAAAVASALAAAGPVAAASTPQSLQAATYLISCPGLAPFLATSPTPPSAAGVGTPMAVIPQGQFHVPTLAGLVMICSATNVLTGENVGNVPILIAPAAD